MIMMKTTTMTMTMITAKQRSRMDPGVDDEEIAAGEEKVAPTVSLMMKEIMIMIMIITMIMTTTANKTVLYSIRDCNYAVPMDRQHKQQHLREKRRVTSNFSW